MATAPVQFTFEFPPQDVDLILHAIQTAPLGNYTYAQVAGLVARIDAQGRPQLHALAVKKDEAPEAAKSDETA